MRELNLFWGNKGQSIRVGRADAYCAVSHGLAGESNFNQRHHALFKERANAADDIRRLKRLIASLR